MKKLALISVCVLGLAFAGSAAPTSSKMNQAPVKKEAPASKKKAAAKKAEAKPSAVAKPVTPAAPAKK
ncbi:MAG: hypothetical protein Q8N05_22825 [Bacteroidota bacterium]|nr:hypothetical protein [Bacteroidota bacterium]